jgi:hypothetical protein
MAGVALNLHDFRFFIAENLIDFLDVLVGKCLNIDFEILF